jgi:hypothetical protein
MYRFLNIIKSYNIKDEIDKLNFIQTNNFCLLKDTIKKLKSQITEWVHAGKMHITDQGIKSTNVKTVLKTIRKTHNPIENG